MEHGFEREESVDPAREALDRVLGRMNVGDRREVGLEEFQTLMAAIKSEFNLAEEEATGVIDGDTGVYEYKWANSDDMVTVTRVS